MAVATNPLASFVWGAGGSQLTPEEIAKQREVADALAAQGLDFSPVASPWQGLARVADAAVGAYKNHRADQAETANATTNQSLIQSLLGGGSEQFPAAPSGDGQMGQSSSSGTAASTAGVSHDVAQSDPMGLATSLLGKGEVPDRSTIQEYLKNGGVNLDPATTAWCAAFVNASLGQAGMKGTGSNLARSFLNYGEETDQPQKGDIAVFSRGDPKGPYGHVGFFDSVNPDGTIRILAGNQGNAVSYGNMPASRLLGYRHVGDQAASALDAVNAMAGGQPTQVASNDPSIGMGAPVNSVTPVPADKVNRQAGQPIATDAPTQRIMSALMNPQPMGGPSGMMAQQTAQASPAAPQASQDLSRIPVSAGGNAGVYKPGQGPSMQAIVQALSSPYADDQTKKIAVLLLGQQIKQQQQASDPMRALDMEYKRAQIGALQAKPDQIPDSVQALDLRAQRAGLQPGTPEYNDFMISGGSKGQTINVDTKGETEYDKAFGKNLAEKTIGILDAGQQAPNKIATYNQLLQTLPGMYTGTGGDTILSAKRALKGLGFDTGDLSGPEFIQAMGNQMALELRNPAGGAGMPGAMSDKDREFLASMSPGLTKTPEGNKKLLEYRIALEQRNQQVAQLANQYMNSHGGRIDNNFYSELSKWSDANPLFPEKPKKTVTPDGYTIEEVQ